MIKIWNLVPNQSKAIPVPMYAKPTAPPSQYPGAVSVQAPMYQQAPMPVQGTVVMPQAPMPVQGTVVMPQAQMPVQGTVVMPPAVPITGQVMGHHQVAAPQMVVVQQQVILPVVYGAQPQGITCPSCRQQVTTRTVGVVGNFGLVFMAGACFCGFCCCAPLPFCVDSLKDQEHFCPSCNGRVGVFKHGM